jgi:putative oxidoreductase
MLKFLFPSMNDDKKLSSLLLALRVIFGLYLAFHGWQKLVGFSTMSSAFPDPLGIGSELSLLLAIFGELVCSLAFVFGFLFRLSTLPMIFTMMIAYVVAKQELALVYLVLFAIIYIAGPGKYAFDSVIGQWANMKFRKK